MPDGDLNINAPIAATKVMYAAVNAENLHVIRKDFLLVHIAVIPVT